MPRLLDPRHEAFCRAYVRGPCAGLVCDAYEAAGYTRDSGNASRLFRQHDIRTRIAELQAGDAALERQALRTALAEGAIDKTKVVQELAKVAFARASDYVDGEGCVDLTRIAGDTGAAVRDLSIDCVATPDGKQKVTRLRLRMNDKRQALLDLARQIDLAHEPPVWLLDDTSKRTWAQEKGKFFARLRDYAEQGEDVMALAAEAVAAAQAPNSAETLAEPGAAASGGAATAEPGSQQ